MRAPWNSDLTPRWENDILPGLIEAEERLAERQAARFDRFPAAYSPRHSYGDRTLWRWVDPTDPYSPLVNREGFTPDGRQLFKKGNAA